MVYTVVLKFVQYNAYKCINFYSCVIDMIVKFYENGISIFLIVTTTTTITTTTTLLLLQLLLQLTLL